jgi:N-acetylneuraminate synthase/N,N'-diacetyllegionaminate synthase
MTDSKIPVAARRGWRGRHGPLLIAEIGGNHEGDFEYAKELTTLAIEAGADVVKFQVYYADDLVNPKESPDRHEHFKRFELDPEQHIELAEMCIAADVEYLASVWSLGALDWLDPYLSMYKVGSGDLTSHWILEQFAERGKPIVLSTGLSTLEEVVEAVEVVRRVDERYCDSEQLAVLQCTSTYPLPKRDANLRAMETLRTATAAAIGYSDHTTDGQAVRLAVALGAEVLEFHFTDTRDGKEFRDHFVSLTPDELVQLTRDLDDIPLLLGDGVKRPLESEIEAGHVESFRRAVYFRRAMQAGETIRREDLVLLRPMHGLDASRLSEVVGHRLATGVEAFDPIDLDQHLS